MSSYSQRTGTAIALSHTAGQDNQGMSDREIAFRWMLTLIKNNNKILIYQSDNARVLTQKYLDPYIKLNLLALQIGGCSI